MSMGWDSDGDLLGAVSNDSANLVIWDANAQKSVSIDTNLRDPLTMLVWARTGPLVAVGSLRGNLSLYNHKTSRRVPVIGKHLKAIVCGAWSKSNLLALGSEDKTLSISASDGDTLRLATLRDVPSCVRFSEMKSDERASEENTVSLIVGNKTLYLFNLMDPDNPVELAFQTKYGDLMEYHWFGDGYVLLGFSLGFLVVISTHLKEIGQELFQIRNHKEGLRGVAMNLAINKAASFGDNTVKIHELSDLKDTAAVISLDDERGITRIDWSHDGQLLALATENRANLHVYLSRLPQIGVASLTRVARLTSLMHVTISSIINDESNDDFIVIKAEIEPKIIALGPFHLALAMNNRVWFYALEEEERSARLLRDREYLGNITALALSSDYCAVLFEGKLMLHLIESDSEMGDERESKMFPNSSTNTARITSASLSPDYLIYSTDMGHLCYFHLDDFNVIQETKHTCAIHQVFPGLQTVNTIVIDQRFQGHMYFPVEDVWKLIKDFPSGEETRVMWDASDANVAAVFDPADKVVHTLVLNTLDDTDNVITNIGGTRISTTEVPVALNDGNLFSLTRSGKINSTTLITHDFTIVKTGRRDEEELKRALEKNLKLKRYANAFALCRVIDKRESWLLLANEALLQLDFELALRIYQQLRMAAMVWTLRELRHLEDTKLLSAHSRVILGQFDEAQTLFLQSSRPIEALEMRCDLRHWEKALHLARRLAPQRVHWVSKELARDLELEGDFANALKYYEQAVFNEQLNGHDSNEINNGDHKGINDDESNEGIAKKSDWLTDHNTVCESGVARCSLRCGELRRGLQLCRRLQQRSLIRECAQILEEGKHYSDAASLYELGRFYDKSALLYVKLKQWDKIGQLMPMLSSPKIQSQYAKAKELEGQYKDAVKAYRAGRDYDNAIRLLLDPLNEPQAAVALVKEGRSAEGAKLVAKWFVKLGDLRTALEVLVASNLSSEAFSLAQSHSEMELFADVAGSSASMEDLRSMAKHFEASGDALRAGQCYARAKLYSKAVRTLIRSASMRPESSTEALTSAIEAVAQAEIEFNTKRRRNKDDSDEDEEENNSAHLTRQLTDFLLGESDGVPKDPRFLFRLYMARRQLGPAAKTALIIAQEEQKSGNYKSAHTMLFKMATELMNENLIVPRDMRGALLLLHSYTLAKRHIRKGDHLSAARMLIRVCASLSQFPSHTAAILTSAVIECSRSGLVHSAFRLASQLMRPEHRDHVDEKYRKKIESLVRRRPAADAEEPQPLLKPCPNCNSPLVQTETNCGSCRMDAFACIMTGFHLVNDDLAICNSCAFAGTRSLMVAAAESGEACPMCGENFDRDALVQVGFGDVKMADHAKEREQDDEEDNEDNEDDDSTDTN